MASFLDRDFDTLPTGEELPLLVFELGREIVRSARDAAKAHNELDKESIEAFKNGRIRQKDTVRILHEDDGENEPPE